MYSSIQQPEGFTSNSISPEERLRRFSNGQNNGSPNKFRKFLPIIGGLVVAFLLGFAVLFIIEKNKNYELLSPFVIVKNSEGTPTYVPMLENPLNGIKYKADEASSWINSRPIGVMINNHASARPQSGLIDADLVYEIVAEGGITRYLAFFLSTLPEKIGPVRSTREYYLVLVKELGDAMIMHIGWSPQALEAIETWPVRSLGRGGAQFWRDQARLDAGIAIEHTAYVNGKDLRLLGEQLGWEGKRTFDQWKFKDEEKIDQNTKDCKPAECNMLTIDFWYKGDYTGMFKYDRATNSYLRFTGYDEADKPVALIDQESKKQVAVKNVVVQFVKEIAIAGDEKNRLEYELVGSGDATIFQDGKAIKSIWKKEGRDLRTKFYDTNGNEILFNRGKIWVSIVPDRNINQVSY